MRPRGVRRLSVKGPAAAPARVRAVPGAVRRGSPSARPLVGGVEGGGFGPPGCQTPVSSVEKQPGHTRGPSAVDGLDAAARGGCGGGRELRFSRGARAREEEEEERPQRWPSWSWARGELVGVRPGFSSGGSGVLFPCKMAAPGLRAAGRAMNVILRKDARTGRTAILRARSVEGKCSLYTNILTHATFCWSKKLAS